MWDVSSAVCYSIQFFSRQLQQQQQQHNITPRPLARLARVSAQQTPLCQNVRSSCSEFYCALGEKIKVPCFVRVAGSSRYVIHIQLPEKTSRACLSNRSANARKVLYFREGAGSEPASTWENFQPVAMSFRWCSFVCSQLRCLQLATCNFCENLFAPLPIAAIVSLGTIVSIINKKHWKYCPLEVNQPKRQHKKTCDPSERE